MNEEAVQAQNIFLYDRKKLEMTGISDVSAFSDTSVEMSYSGGMIAVEGTELKIDSFSSETGHICITGVVNSFCYYGKAPSQKNGLLRRFLG
ncbi:MAG: sporulation protein YabP [Clostridiales bacterium]|jgi:sporulation protein YabP|nr:sporulation protein YabP [Clostridiales bacterium]